jgi:hypothetical protein
MFNHFSRPRSTRPGNPPHTRVTPVVEKLENKLVPSTGVRGLPVTVAFGGVGGSRNFSIRAEPGSTIKLFVTLHGDPGEATENLRDIDHPGRAGRSFS